MVDAAKFLQWKREIAVAGVLLEVKIDFLVGPLGDLRSQLNVSMPRVRPRGNIQFHAHAVEEAVQIEDGPLAVTVTGKRSTGEAHTGTVFVPQAFPYLMMKLHAFEDRKNKRQEAKERHHALDLYTVVGMMTEKEYDRAKELGTAHAGNEHVARARAIVRDDFASRTAVGMLRLREHELFREDFRLDEFMSVLREILVE